MWLYLLVGHIEQRQSVHIIFEDILYPEIRARIGIQGSFAGIVEPLRTIGAVQMDNTQRTFVRDFRIVL